MFSDVAKEYLHSDLREVRQIMLWKLDGLSEYDIRRPMTRTGTNLLGLVKHLTMTEARYLGEVFGRPFPEDIPWFRRDAERDADKWATERETRDEIVELYKRVCAHADTTIDTLAIDATGHVPGWPMPEVRLFNIMVHVLNETNRHAGHADIVREYLDGTVGADADTAHVLDRGESYWRDHHAKLERTARAFQA